MWLGRGGNCRDAAAASATGRSLATPSIGEGPDAAGFDAKKQLAFSSNGDGTLTIIDASKPDYPVLQTVATKRGARTMAFDASNGRVYVVTSDFGPAPAATAENLCGRAAPAIPRAPATVLRYPRPGVPRITPAYAQPPLVIV